LCAAICAQVVVAALVPPGLTGVVGVVTGETDAAGGVGAATVEGAVLGAAATAGEAGLADALAEAVGVGCDDPQALTSIVPAMTAAPASQRPRADLITLFGCMR
jgi:hypothetical protein